MKPKGIFPRFPVTSADKLATLRKLLSHGITHHKTLADVCGMAPRTVRKYKARLAAQNDPSRIYGENE